MLPHSVWSRISVTSWMSICAFLFPSVCPIDQQQQQQHAVCLLLSAGAAYQISIHLYCRRPNSEADVGSVLLRAEGRGSTQTCHQQDCLWCRLLVQFTFTGGSVFQFLTPHEWDIASTKWKFDSRVCTVGHLSQLFSCVNNLPKVVTGEWNSQVLTHNLWVADVVPPGYT